MGRLRDALALRETTVAVRLELESPWVDNSHLERVTWTELYSSPLAMTRAEAMTVPAVARARHLNVNTIARMPLAAYRAGEPLADQPAWTYRTDGYQSPLHRLAGTVDDLIFHGEALWIAERDREGNITRATHCPWSKWDTNDDGVIEVNGAELTAAQAIHIPGLHEGILTFGTAAIRGAAETLAAAVDTAAHPFRLELHDTGDYPMTRDESQALVADARQAMTEGSGVIYTTPGLEAKLHAVSSDQLLVAGRESFAVDVARLIGLPSAMIDAHSNGATMTYSTTADVVQSFLHLGLTLYMSPITARLSLDDVAPRGTEIRFDTATVLGIEALTSPESAPTREPVTP